ncbi:MAG: hypothetical protein IJ991_02030 [Thermoguttaceae bacterium]|nr:hypothetical protein [Thermoguttaceae bacterium]
MLEAIGIIIACCLGLMQIYEKFWEAPRREKLRIWETRPQLKVVDVKRQSVAELVAGSPFDAEGFFARVETLEWRNGFPYATHRQDDFDSKNWRGAVLTLRNVGKTDINELCVVSVDKGEYSLFNVCDEKQADATHVLNYYLDVDEIRVGETATLALRWNKTSRLPDVYLLSVSYIDKERARYWRQLLSLREEYARNVIEISVDDYLVETNVERAAKLFFGPNI